MSLRNIRRKIYHLSIEDRRDFWRERQLVPLLLRRKFDDYGDKEIPMKDVICKKIDPSTNFHMLIVGKSGRQKTQMMKNMIREYHKAGYRILFFEPKKMDLVYGKYPKQDSYRLPPKFYDDEKGLDVVSYTPSYYYDFVKSFINKNDAKMTNFYSLNMKELISEEIWMSFGVPKKSAQVIIECIKRGNYDIKKIKHAIDKTPFMASTKNVAKGVLDNFANTVFTGKFPPIDLEKLWNDNKIVVINYHGNQGDYINTDIGLLILQARNIGAKEEDVTKKLLIFDDAFMYAGASSYKFAQGEINFAQVQIANCQYNYRSFGIDTIVAIQNLDVASIQETLVEGRDEFLITRTGSSEILRKLIPSDAYDMAVNQNPFEGKVLGSDKKNYYFEWIYCDEESFVKTGYPFDCFVYHPQVGKKLDMKT